MKFYRISENGINLIKKFEGLRLETYLCEAGIPTIGYGSTKGVTEGMFITKAAADETLREDLWDVKDAINRCVNVELNQNQVDVLYSFIFNLGETNFKSSTLLRKINANDLDAVPEQLMRWVYAGGKVSKGLQKRRAQEAELWESEE